MPSCYQENRSYVLMYCTRCLRSSLLLYMSIPLLLSDTFMLSYTVYEYFFTKLYNCIFGAVKHTHTHTHRKTFSENSDTDFHYVENQNSRQIEQQYKLN